MERRAIPRPQRVLLVDDSRDVREMWKMWLTIWGFAVEEASNGAEAVQKARDTDPALVLMDLCMPVLDGLGATERIKANPLTAHIPILALSAAAPPVGRAEAAGCDVLLRKPLEPQELLEHIRASFAARRLASGS